PNFVTAKPDLAHVEEKSSRIVLIAAFLEPIAAALKAIFARTFPNLPQTHQFRATRELKLAPTELNLAPGQPRLAPAEPELAPAKPKSASFEPRPAPGEPPPAPSRLIAA